MNCVVTINAIVLDGLRRLVLSQGAIVAMFSDDKQSAVNKTANFSFRAGFSPYKRWKTISKPKCKISKGIYSSRIHSKTTFSSLLSQPPPPPPHTHTHTHTRTHAFYKRKCKKYCLVPN